MPTCLSFGACSINCPMRRSARLRISTETVTGPLGQLQIARRATSPPRGLIGTLLDAHYDDHSFPATVPAGAIAAARAEPQNRQRVLLRYKRRVSRCCTFQRQGGQSGADRGGGASPPLCGGPSRSADAGTWDPHGRGGISSQAVHGEESKR